MTQDKIILSQAKIILKVENKRYLEKNVVPLCLSLIKKGAFAKIAEIEETRYMLMDTGESYRIRFDRKAGTVHLVHMKIEHRNFNKDYLNNQFDRENTDLRGGIVDSVAHQSGEMLKEKYHLTGSSSESADTHKTQTVPRLSGRQLLHDLTAAVPSYLAAIRAVYTSEVNFLSVRYLTANPAFSKEKHEEAVYEVEQKITEILNNFRDEHSHYESESNMQTASALLDDLKASPGIKNNKELKSALSALQEPQIREYFLLQRTARLLEKTIGGLFAQFDRFLIPDEDHPAGTDDKIKLLNPDSHLNVSLQKTKLISTNGLTNLIGDILHDPANHSRFDLNAIIEDSG